MLSSAEWAKKRKKEIRQRLTIAAVCFTAAAVLLLWGILLRRDAVASEAQPQASSYYEEQLPVSSSVSDTADMVLMEELADDTTAVPTMAPKREHKNWLVDVQDVYDPALGNYELINISGFRPYVFAPDGAGSDSPNNVVSVTKLVERYGKAEHMVLALNAGIFYDTLATKVYCFAGKQPDGILIAGGTVLKSVETVDHTECAPLVIDEDGSVGWTDYYADADALARGEGYYYDIHGRKVEGKKIISAVCGFVPILVDGKNLYDPAGAPLYGYANYVNHYFGRWGRQVLGVKEDGSFVILTVTTKSWSLKMAADAALEQGCVFAYNLDGGFSIETVVSDFTGERDRIETLNKVNWGNQIPACLVFTDDGIAPVSAVPESLSVSIKADAFSAGASLSDIAEGIAVSESLSNANGHSSERRLYSSLTATEELEHSIMNAAGAKLRSSTSPAGNLIYTKSSSEAWSCLSMNDNSRFDGKYYDYSTGYSLSTEDDLSTPGDKTIHISYDPGGGWKELTADFTVELK